MADILIDELRTRLRELCRITEDDLRLPFGEAARTVMLRIEESIIHSIPVRDVVGAVLASLGTDFGGDLHTALEYAARQANKGEDLSKVPPGTSHEALATFYERVVVPCLEAKGEALAGLAERHPDLTTTERLILKIGHKIGVQFNAMFIKWWQLAILPLRKSQLSQKDIKRLLSKARKTNRYAVLMAPDGRPIEALTEETILQGVQVSLANAFPDEIAEARAKLLCLVMELPRSEREYRKYFLALANALGCRDFKEMTRRWLAVDKAWVLIPHTVRAVPVHMMEWGYQHPYAISPEYRVCWRMNEFTSIIATMREQMERLALELGDGTDVTKLEHTDVVEVLNVVQGGCCIDFAYAGQSVPNAPAAQIMGMKSLLATEAMKVRLERHIWMLQRCLSPSTLRWLLGNFTLQEMYGLVVGHELGHSFVTSNRLLRVFGATKHQIEEGKATVLGILGMSRSDRWTPLQLAAVIFDDCLRMLGKELFTDPTHAPYANECMLILSVLRRHGAVVIVDGKLEMSVSTANSGLIARWIYEDLVIPLVAAYKAADLNTIQDILAEKANPMAGDIWPVRELIDANLAKA